MNGPTKKKLRKKKKKKQDRNRLSLSAYRRLFFTIMLLTILEHFFDSYKEEKWCTRMLIS